MRQYSVSGPATSRIARSRRLRSRMDPAGSLPAGCCPSPRSIGSHDRLKARYSNRRRTRHRRGDLRSTTRRTPDLTLWWPEERGWPGADLCCAATCRALYHIFPNATLLANLFKHPSEARHILSSVHGLITQPPMPVCRIQQNCFPLRPRAASPVRCRLPAPAPSVPHACPDNRRRSLYQHPHTGDYPLPGSSTRRAHPLLCAPVPGDAVSKAQTRDA